MLYMTVIDVTTLSVLYSNQSRFMSLAVTFYNHTFYNRIREVKIKLDEESDKLAFALRD